MKLFPRGCCKEKHFHNTWMPFFSVVDVCVFTYDVTRVCEPRLQASRVCVHRILHLCAYFMTLSASLSNCMQFICVRFYFFSKRRGSVCTLVKFSCMGVLFF